MSSPNLSLPVMASRLGSWLGRFAGGLAVAACVLSGVTDGQAQPANDFRASSEVLDGSLTNGVVAGTTFDATAETGEPDHAFVPASKSVWYSFRPDAGGFYGFYTGDTTQDTVLAIYEDPFLTPPGVGSNDDILAGFDRQSRVVVALTTGTQYLIAVDSKSALGDPFRLFWNSCTGGPLGVPNYINIPSGRILEREYLVEWLPISGADRYQVLVDGRPITVTPDTQVSVSLEIGENRITVRGINDCGPGPGEDLLIYSCPDGAVIYRGPVDGAQFSRGQDVILSWSSVADALDYQLIIDGEIVVVPGTSINIRDIVTPNGYRPIDDGVHTWGVRARFGDPVCDDPPVPERTYNICDRPTVFVVLDTPDNTVFTPNTTGTLDYFYFTTSTVTVNSMDVYINGVLVQSGPDFFYQETFTQLGTYEWFVEVHTDPPTSCSVYRSRTGRFCVGPVQVAPVFPAEGDRFNCGTVDEFRWTYGGPITDLLETTVFLNGVPIATTTGTSYKLSTPLTAGSYTWALETTGGLGVCALPPTVRGVNFCVQDLATDITAVAPGDGSTLTTHPASLEWTPLCGATQYSVFFNGTQIGTTTETVFALDATTNPLINLVDGINEWQIRADGVCGSQGISNRFTYDADPCSVAPTPPQILNLSTTVTIVRCPGDLGIDYILPVGTTTGTLFVDGFGTFEIDDTGTTSVSGLPVGCYTVRIAADTVCGPVVSVDYDVTVLPVYFLTSPVNSRAEVIRPVACGPQVARWQVDCAAMDTTYSIFLDGFLLGETTGTEFFLGNLGAGSYNLVVQVPAVCGVQDPVNITLCVLSPPDQAIVPTDGAVLAAQPDRLEWAGCAGPGTAYDVYLNGDFLGDTTSTVFAIDTSLTLSGLNQWRVLARANCGTTSSVNFEYTYDPTLCPTTRPTILLPTSGTVIRCGDDLTVNYTLPAGVTTATISVGTVASIEGTTDGEVIFFGLPVGCYAVTVEYTTPCDTIVSLETAVEVVPTVRFTGPGDPSAFPPTPLFCGPQTLTWEIFCGPTPDTTVTVVLNGLALGQTTDTQFFLGNLPPGNYTAEVVIADLCGGRPQTSTYPFCLRAQITNAVQPLNGEILTSPPLILEWVGCTDGTINYGVRLNGTPVGSTTDTLIAVSPALSVDGLNTWSVDAISPCGARFGVTFQYFYDSTGCLRPSAVNAVFPLDDPFTPLPCGLNTLSWEQPAISIPAISYRVFVDGAFIQETTDTVLNLLTPLSGGVHTWDVVPVNICGEGTTASFSFCLQDTPVILFPADGSTIDCSSTLEIRWDGGCGTTSYDVILDGITVGTTTGLSLELSAALPTGPHTLQIVATGVCGITSTDVQTFCVQSVPIQVTPANGSVFPGALPTELEWQPACGATTYGVFLNGVELGRTTDTTIPISLTPGTGPFLWQVEAEGDCGLTTSPLWIFSDCAGVPPPANPVPFDGETTDGGLPTELRWDPVIGATSYQVFINGSFVTTVPTPVYVLPIVLPELDYTWQIIANVAGCGTIPGPVWNFTVCTVVPAPIPLFPFAGETTRPQNIQFDWTDVPGTISYRVQVDNFVSGDLFTSDFNFGVPLVSGLRTWAPVSRTSCGFTTAPLTTFCVLDGAVNPFPADGAVLCAIPTLFDWNDVLSGLSYDLIIDGTVVATSVTLSEAAFTGNLALGVHTWQVIAYNECGQMPSEVWTFEITDSGIPSPLSWQTDGVVHTLATDGFRMYIGGEFENLVSPDGLNQTPRRNIAALDLVTGLPTTWNPGADAVVYALAVGNGQVYAGGDFTLYGGVTQNRLGAVLASGGTPAPLASTVAPNLPVRALALSPDGGTLYFGGDFNRVGSVLRPFVASVDTLTGNLTSFNPSPNNRVRALAVEPGGDVFVGGIFNEVGAVTRPGLFRATTTGSLTTFDAQCDLYVYALNLRPTGLRVGGFFNTIGGQPRTHLAQIDTTSGLASAWNPQVDGTVLAIEPVADDVLIGGLFSQVGSFNRPYLARVSGVTGLPIDCGYDPDYPVRTIFRYTTTVWVGGDFTLVGGRVNRGLAGFGSIVAPENRAGDWELFD